MITLAVFVLGYLYCLTQFPAQKPIALARNTPVKAITDPTDRSIPPLRITKVMPLYCLTQFPGFASTRVICNILTDNAFLGIIAVGMTFVKGKLRFITAASPFQ
jgi:hypothetical protein